MSEGSKHYGEEYNRKGRDNNKVTCSQLKLLISQSKKLCSPRLCLSDSKKPPPSVGNDRESYFICC